jgi:hypothetical protein
VKKTNLIIAGIAVVLLLGGGYFYLSSKNKKTSTNSNQASVTSEQAENLSPRSLMDLLALGTSEKCTYSDASAPAAVEGTSYISNGKIRTDYSTTIEGKQTSGHMIFDGNTDYVWIDGELTGITMEVDTSKNIESNSENATQDGVNINKALNYKCSPWVPDESLFQPPSNIEFQSLAIPTITQEDSSTNTNLCDTCSSLTGDQKIQCLKALNCN